VLSGHAKVGGGVSFLGEIFEIQELASRLETENEAYGPFARQLQKLARGGDIEQLQIFIKQYFS
jgi:hypothetical protein